jgi:hypothetical protein
MPVCRQGEAEAELGLAAAGLATIEEFVGFAVIRC